MLNKQEFKSIELYELSLSFCHSMQGKKTDKQFRRQKCEIERILKEYFSGIYLTDINKEFFVELFQRCIPKRGKADTKYLARFMHHLILEGVLFENYELFEAYYEQRISVRSQADDVIQILTNPDFKLYFEKELYTKPDLITLSFLTHDGKVFVSDETRNYIDKYLMALKIDDTAAVLTRIANYRHSISCFYDYLKTVNIELLTQKDVLGFFYDALEMGLHNHFKYLLRFVLYLAEIRYYIDGRFDFLINLKSYIQFGGYTPDTIIRIFSDSVPDKFRLYSKTRSIASDRNFLIYINAENIEIRNFINEFLCIHGHTLPVINEFCNDFTKSLNKNEVENISDFNYLTFMSQIDYARNKMQSIDCVAFIVGLYDYIARNYNSKIFYPLKIDSVILQRHSLTSELFNGYDIVSYNPSEEPTTSDKFVLQYFGKADTNTTITTTKAFAVNLEDIECSEYRYWVKHYIWKSSPALYTKIQTSMQNKMMLNYIYGIKTSINISIYGRKSNDLSITVRDALAYRTYINQKTENQKSRYAYTKSARLLLSHVIDNKLGNVDKGAFYNLSTPADNFGNHNPQPINNNDLEKLAKVINEKAKINNYYFVLSSIFYLSLETELRLSNILTLKIASISEAAKKNQYVINAKTKTSAKQEVDTPITIYTKKHLDDVIEATNDLRQSSINSEIKKYIFIRPGSKIDSISLMRKKEVNDHFRNCCLEAGITIYNSSNLRDTHMTKAEEYIIRNSLSSLFQNILSGHSSPTVDRKHYVDLEIKDLLESVHGTIIGNIDIAGRVIDSLPKEIASPDNEVSNECGYCDSQSCNNFTYLDCLLCKDFVATVDRIPFFEAQIRTIDQKIEKAIIVHDKEDLVNIKRLLLNYLQALLALKKGKK